MWEDEADCHKRRQVQRRPHHAHTAPPGQLSCQLRLLCCIAQQIVNRAPCAIFCNQQSEERQSASG